MLTLATVWAINFFLVLPALNPWFITLMPYLVTSASKMLFALTMAIILAWPELHRLAQERKWPKRLTG